MYTTLDWDVYVELMVMNHGNQAPAVNEAPPRDPSS